ncbi:MAG: hypothetical protein WCP29_04350 [Acidobacteriota bacterium]
MKWTGAPACGLLVLLVAAGVSPAQAGEILFSVRDGRVTLVARDAQLSDILAVWEREGRTKIIARERVQGVVLTLDFKDEPEATALATVLRSVTGYIAAKYPVAPRDGSSYRCIVINPVPAPNVFVQAGAPGRPSPAPQPQAQAPSGFPPSITSDAGYFPPAFVPTPGDEAEDSGASRAPAAAGPRQPGMMMPSGPTRPPMDPSALADTAGARAPQSPATTPSFSGAGTGVPGAVVPAPPLPGTPPVPGPPKGPGLR